MTAVELNGLPYIAVNIDRLIHLLENTTIVPEPVLLETNSVLSDTEFSLLCESELSELMAEYQRMTAYIERIADSWTRDLFHQRFVQQKSFREIGILKGLPSGTIKHEVYSYLRRHPEDYISSRDLADKWGLHIDTINSYCRRGLLPGAFKEDNRQHWMIPEKSVRPQFSGRCYHAPQIPLSHMGTSELGKKLGVSPGMISKRCKRGDFPGAFKYYHGIWIIPRRYAQTQKQP